MPKKQQATLKCSQCRQEFQGKTTDNCKFCHSPHTEVLIDPEAIDRKAKEEKERRAEADRVKEAAQKKPPRRLRKIAKKASKKKAAKS